MIDWVSIVRESTHRRFSHMGMYFAVPGRMRGGHRQHRQHQEHRKPARRCHRESVVLADVNEDDELEREAVAVVDVVDEDRSSRIDMSSNSLQCTCCFSRVLLRHGIPSFLLRSFFFSLSLSFHYWGR